MFYYEGQSCPVCGRPFSPDDDIVSCPVCGLPHHRGCWQKDGHCHLSHLHGTPQQWARDAAQAEAPATEPDEDDPEQVCPGCGAHNPEFAEFCKSCGRPLGSKEWHSADRRQANAPNYHEYRPFSAPYQPSSCYDENEIIDGDRATELAAYVGSRADRYIPCFRRMAHGRSAGWNWAAFFLGPLWMLYRRMYSGGVLLLGLQMLSSVISTLALDRMGIQTIEQLYALLEQVMAGGTLNKVQTYCLLSIWLISGILFAARLSVAVFGDRLYRRHCGAAIRRAKIKAPDISTGELAFLGGTSVAIAAIGYITQYFLTQIIALLM